MKRPRLAIDLTLARKAGSALVDQGISSLTNFALTLTAARTLDPHEFGAFSLGFSAYILSLGISRHVCSDPLSIRYSSAALEVRRGAIARATGSALIIGLGSGLVLMALSVFVRGPTRTAFLAFAPFLPLLLLQDAWRYAFFTSGAGWHAAVNDLVWGVALGLGIIVLAVSSITSLTAYAVVWGGTGALAGIVGMFQTKLLPRPKESVRWWREQGGLAGRLVGEFLTTTGTSQLSLYVIAGVAGLRAAGGIRAAQVLLGPLSVLFMSANLFALPEASRRAHDNPILLFRFARGVSIALTSIAIAWTVGLIILPASAGVALLRQNWEPAKVLVLPLGIVMACTVGGSGGLLVLRALARARASFTIRLFLAGPVITAAALGAWLAGAPGAAWGLAGVSAIGATIWWIVARLNLKPPYSRGDTTSLVKLPLEEEQSV